LKIDFVENSPKTMIFDPEWGRFRPEDNIQHVGFHVRLAGTLKAVRDHEGGFDKMREDFLKQFPESPSPYR